MSNSDPPATIPRARSTTLWSPIPKALHHHVTSPRTLIASPPLLKSVSVTLRQPRRIVASANAVGGWSIGDAPYDLMRAAWGSIQAHSSRSRCVRIHGRDRAPDGWNSSRIVSIKPPDEVLEWLCIQEPAAIPVKIHRSVEKSASFRCRKSRTSSLEGKGTQF
jgi:hypothetical protein